MTGYLRAKEEIGVIPNVLEYRIYNDTGARKKETGFTVRTSVFVDRTNQQGIYVYMDKLK